MANDLPPFIDPEEKVLQEIEDTFIEVEEEECEEIIEIEEVLFA